MEAPRHSPSGAGPDRLTIVRRRRPWPWVGGAAILYMLLSLADLLITNDGWQWEVVGRYLFSAPVLKGVMATLLLTLLAEGIGLALGLVLALMRLSESPLPRWTSAGFIWIFRAVPPLVIVLFIYFLSALVPNLAIGIPFGPSWKIVETNSVVTQLVAAALGLGLAQAAYAAEILRAGILSVPEGQTNAARALGMTPLQVMRHVVFPQALRMIVPPLGNEVIAMVKATSLVSVIAYTELLTTVQVIYARNFQQIPLLMVAVIWYGVITSVLTLLQSRIERRLNRPSAASGVRR